MGDVFIFIHLPDISSKTFLKVSVVAKSAQHRDGKISSYFRSENSRGLVQSYCSWGREETPMYFNQYHADTIIANI